MQYAQKGEITPEMEIVAQKEHVNKETLLEYIASGSIVIPANIYHLKKNLAPMGIGKGLSTKVNANIGASPHIHDLSIELEKVKYCEEYGADTLMDLSTAGDIDFYRQSIIDISSIPLGTVPLYQVVEKYGIAGFTPKQCLEVIETQAKQGVDYMTIHAGFKRDFIPFVKERTMGTVSRGGGILQKWMEKNKQENPLLQVFNEIITIFSKYDVTISLGDTLRPGGLCDCNDKAQISELKFLGELTKRAWKKGVQVMVEGPGHVPIHMIKEQVEYQKKYCYGAPFYVLGPLTIDTGVGYDHITGAIGGAVAASHGADMLCYVTAAEHLSLPHPEDVKEGIIAFRIAARSGDIAKDVPGAWEREKEMSLARKQLHWKKMKEMSMDPERFKKYRFERGYSGVACGMCGEKFCPMKEETIMTEKELFEGSDTSKKN
jgi:phosphomethylpyrimidine synthase